MANDANGTAVSEDGGDSRNRIALPAILDLTRVAELKVELEEALSRASDAVVDASEVQKVTSPCLELLVAAKRSFAEAGGIDLRLQSPSPAFIDTARTLGLADLLELPGA